MESKYFYHAINITLDIYEEIRAVSEKIAEQEGISFEEAYLEFSKSPVYEALQNTETVMWSESVPYIVDDYYRKK